MKGFNVKILGINFKVEYFDEAGPRDNEMGTTDVKAGKILICHQMPSDIQQQTFLHEVVEALSVLGGLGIPTKKVEALSRLIWSFMSDNPHLFPRLPLMGGK